MSLCERYETREAGSRLKAEVFGASSSSANFRITPAAHGCPSRSQSTNGERPNHVARSEFESAYRPARCNCALRDPQAQDLSPSPHEPASWDRSHRDHETQTRHRASQLGLALDEIQLFA